MILLTFLHPCLMHGKCFFFPPPLLIIDVQHYMCVLCASLIRKSVGFYNCCSTVSPRKGKTKNQRSRAVCKNHSLSSKQSYKILLDAVGNMEGRVSKR